MPPLARRLSPPSANPQLQSTSQVLQTAHDLLAACPTSLYLIHTQPHAHASDLRDAQTGRCLAPSLCGSAGAPAAASSFGVAEMVGGDVSVAALQEYIEVACTRAGREHSVAVTQLDALPREGEERKAAMLKAGMCCVSLPFLISLFSLHTLLRGGDGDQAI